MFGMQSLLHIPTAAYPKRASLSSRMVRLAGREQVSYTSLMLPYRDSRITRVVLVVFFILVVVYAYYEARGILFGPSIEVTSSIEEVTEPFISISGKAERISSLTMNGNPVAVTETGEFSEPYLLSPGINRIVLDAEDTYGTKRQKIIQIVYTPSPTPPIAPPTASSTLEDLQGTTTPPALEQQM